MPRFRVLLAVVMAVVAAPSLAALAQVNGQNETSNPGQNYYYDSSGRPWMLGSDGQWYMINNYAAPHQYQFDDQGRLWTLDESGNWVLGQATPSSSRSRYDNQGNRWVSDRSGDWFVANPEPPDRGGDDGYDYDDYGNRYCRDYDNEWRGHSRGGRGDWRERYANDVPYWGHTRSFDQPPAFYDDLGRLWVQDTAGTWRQSGNESVTLQDLPPGAGRPATPWIGRVIPGYPTPEASDIYGIPTRPEDVNWLSQPGATGATGGGGWISTPGTVGTFGVPPSVGTGEVPGEPDFFRSNPGATGQGEINQSPWTGQGAINQGPWTGQGVGGPSTGQGAVGMSPGVGGFGGPSTGQGAVGMSPGVGGFGGPSTGQGAIGMGAGAGGMSGGMGGGGRGGGHGGGGGGGK